MKISDLIGEYKKMFGATSQHKQPIVDSIQVSNIPQQELVQPETEDKADTTTMVAPLQQKLELLKKAVDVDSYYDNEGQEPTKTSNSPINITLNIPQGHSNTKIDLIVNGQPVDELDQIKKIAGVPTATIFDAGDDEPLES